MNAFRNHQRVICFQESLLHKLTITNWTSCAEQRLCPVEVREFIYFDTFSCVLGAWYISCGCCHRVKRSGLLGGWSDTPRIKYIMFLPNTPLLLLATVVRGVNTLLGRADAVMATARGALPRKSITSSVPVLIPCCFAMSRKPDFQPAAQRQLGGLRTILRSLHPQTCAGSDIP